MRTCEYCGERPIAEGNRRYCEECSRLARKRWKREQRERARKLATGAPGEVPLYAQEYADPDKARRYHREYMRRRRAAQRLQRESGAQARAGPGKGARKKRELGQANLHRAGIVKERANPWPGHAEKRRRHAATHALRQRGIVARAP